MKQLHRAAGQVSVSAFLMLALAQAWAQGPAAVPGRFTPSTDGQEVLDTKTNLLWRRCVEGMKWDGKTCTGKPTALTLTVAKKHVGAVSKADNKAWRIPNRDELVGLIVKPQKKPLIDAAAFPNTPSTVYWALRPGYTDNLNAWMIDFGNGHVYGSSGSKHNLRLVRSN